MKKNNLKKIIYYSAFICAVIFSCVLFFLFVFLPVYKQVTFSGLVFMQINRGDAFYMKTQEGIEVIWDGGDDKKFLERLADYRPFFDKTIDLWIITHPDADHYYGGLEILRHVNIENIMLTGVDKNDAKYHEIFRIAKERNINIIYADKTKDLQIGSSILIDTLYPFESIYASRKKEEIGNNFSIIQKLYILKSTTNTVNSVLLTGDIEKTTEEKILLSGVDISADILKIAHHGSKSSSSENFLKAVNPQRAVITTGTKNSFHHPHDETLEVLQKLQIDFDNTKNGDVVIDL